MYTDNRLQPIDDNAQYIGADGTKYPRNYPKDEIQGLHAVTLVAKPTGDDIIVTGFTIDDGFNQVWEWRAKTADELAADQLVAANIQLAALLPDRLAALEKAVLHNDKADLTDVAAQVSTLNTQISTAQTTIDSSQQISVESLKA